MSLLFNMLSKFVIAFLPRSKHLLISWQRVLKKDGDESRIQRLRSHLETLEPSISGPNRLWLDWAEGTLRGAGSCRNELGMRKGLECCEESEDFSTLPHC